jgi:hypothetical protein
MALAAEFNGGRITFKSPTHMDNLILQPRIVRAKHAPGYLGMCRDVFNKTVRPYVREFPIGEQGIGFDRLELDAWADTYISTNSIDKKPPPSITIPPDVSSRDFKVDPLTKDVAARSRPLTDTHAKSKVEFERVLAMVRGTKGSQSRNKN